MTHLVITFPAPDVPASINEVSGRHWSQARKRNTPWREWTAYWVRRQGPSPARHVPVPITVQVTLPFRQKRRRDPHNYTGTTVKAIVDGLVKSGVVPDDTDDWVTVLDPVLTIVPKGTPLEATITIEPRSNA